MKITLFGLTIFSDNKGCEALACSFLDLLQKICSENSEKLDIAIYIFAQEEKKSILENPCWQNLRISVRQVKLRKRCFSQEFWKTLKDDVKKSTLCFDFTEGDSFTDLYGLKRFCVQSFIKSFVIRKANNLVLGPQTYGPFKTTFSRIWASWIVKRSKKVYSRDEISLNELSKITKRYVQAVTDIAIVLRPKISCILKSDKIKIGLNISGLLWNGGYTRNNQFNLTVDYKSYIENLVKILSENNSYEVYLIPHVITDDDYNCVENDFKICLSMHKRFPSTKFIDTVSSPAELKGLISQMDVFTGARMHSTIAAFSTKVPVIPFSYSKKFEGFFLALQYGYIIDGKSLSTEEALKRTLEYISKFDELKEPVCKSFEVAENKIQLFENEIISLLKIKQLQ